MCGRRCFDNNLITQQLANFSAKPLTLVLLSPIYPVFANSVDPDQLASEEAN